MPFYEECTLLDFFSSPSLKISLRREYVHLRDIKVSGDVHLMELLELKIKLVVGYFRI
jgi:hypothetical protein